MSGKSWRIAEMGPGGQLEEEVLAGTDGWLFLVGGTNQVANAYLDENGEFDGIIAQWAQRLKARREAANAIGARYCHLIAPEKLSIYGDRIEVLKLARNNGLGARLSRAAATSGIEEVVANPTNYMERMKNDYLLYWKTDTHWTFHGCLCAYQILCGKLGIKPSIEIGSARYQTGTITLDLGAKMDPPITELFTLADFVRKARLVSSNALVNYKVKHDRENDAGLHVGSNVVYVNFSDTAVPRKVVLFGDSFAEYRPHLLTGMLAETFAEVHFVWSTSIDWTYVNRVKPDILLTEATERFLTRVPDDRFAVVDSVRRKPWIRRIFSGSDSDFSAMRSPDG